MRILKIPSWYMPEGGQFCLQQALALKNSGIDVHILANVTIPLTKYKTKYFSFPTKPFYEENNSILIYKNYFRKIPKLEQYNINRWVSKTLKLFNQYVKKHGFPDIIHAHSATWAGVVASLIKMQYGIPYVITEHRGVFSENSKIKIDSFPTFYFPLLEQAYASANAIITVSNQLQKNILNIAKKEVPIYTVSNTIEDLFFEKTSILKKERFTFINANSYGFVKGYDILFPAFDKVCEQYNNTQLIILGTDFDCDDFHKIWKNFQHKDNVFMAGFQNKKAVKTYLERSHAFVLSSRVESQSIAVLEALACGLPIVCTEVVPKEISPNEVAIRCKTESIDSLANGMLRMIESYDQFDKERIQKFALSICSNNTFVKKITTIYDSIICTTTL